MAISGQANINIGVENESVDSDSLYVAFNKVQNNFTKLFTTASPSVSANNDSGLNVTTSGNTVFITNTGVTAITAGTNIIISGSNGNVEISSTGGGGGGSGGTVTSVGLTPATGITIGGTNPIISNGVMTVGLAAVSPNPAGSYTYPSVTVDQFGRVTGISSGASVGTVTSVGVVAVGDGLSIANSPVTTNGTISIQNTGVTRLNAGTGITLSGSTGNISISASGSGGSGGGSVTSVGLSSNTLVVSSLPVTTSGTLLINLPNTITLSGNITGNNLITTGNAVVGGILTDNYYYANGSPLDFQRPSGSNTQIQFNSNNDFGASANLTFDTTTNTLSATKISGTLTSASQPNVTTVGTLTSLSVAGNITSGNISGGNLVSANYFSGRLTTASQTNITTVGTLTSLTVAGNITSGNVSGGNLVSANYFSGNGSFLTGVGAATSTTAGTVTTNAQPNITSVGILNGLTVGGNITSTNANLGNSVVASYFIGNFYGTANSAATATTSTTATKAGTVTTNAQPNITSVGTLSSLNVTGTATSGNLTSNGILLLNGSEDLADLASANLLVTASYFTTVVAETATLAAGTNGQIKTLMMNGNAGDMVITVTNPGWGGAGSITFNAVGQGCTLQYVNSKWFCIGNNGAIFA